MTEYNLNFEVNGEKVAIQVPARRTLLDCLRNDLALTGTKRVCDMGDCGACTVSVDGRPVYSCLLLALDAEGSQVTTIEGVANGDVLDPVQAAFIEADAFQCGFCTPGQVMTIRALLTANPHTTRDEILRSLSGNLCRCGAYQNLIRAAEMVSARTHG